MASALAAFTEISYRAFDGGCEVTVSKLMSAISFESEDYLDRQLELAQFLADSRLELRPALSQGELDDDRVLIYTERSRGFSSRLNDLIAIGEQSRVEYKSTAFVSVRRIRETGADPGDCWDEGVVLSILKSICGYLNKDGGEIYVGVEANRNICGIELDFPVLSQRSRDFDGWVNRFLDLIRARFHECNEVINYLDFDVEQINSFLVVRILVRPRAKISFVQDGDSIFRCYVRASASILEIRIHEMPAFIESKVLPSVTSY